MRDFSSVHVRPSDLVGRHFSTVIVGGGINGVGVFRDLSLQGVDCLLVDKGDFASGASSAPSRMIHGGLRYLENGSFSLVAEATRERNLLLRNAPHLVRPLETMVPLRNWFGGLMSSALRFFGRTPSQRSRGLLAVALGLRLYDALGRRQRALPAHRIKRLSAKDQQSFDAAIRWAATYYDAWISHPEWLVLELLADAHRDESRSLASNYCEVLACSGNSLVLRDNITGEQLSVTADCVVNAGGAWLDQCTQVLGGGAQRVMGTKGSHLVLNHCGLRDALNQRMAYFEAPDGRVCIVYPFLNRVLLGSTDIPVDTPEHVRTDAAEVDYLLDVLRELFPHFRIGREHVIYTYVGVRPLGRANADTPGKISRDHSVVIEPPNAERNLPIISLVGGKWTTFRALAEEASDRVLQHLQRKRLHGTQQRPIGGGADYPMDTTGIDTLLAQLMAQGTRSRERAQTLLQRYGSAALPMAKSWALPDDTPLQHAPSYSRAEVRHLCLHTGVMHLSDLVIRRTLLAMRGELTSAALQELAEVAGAALGWSDDELTRQLHACTQRLCDHHGVRLAPAEVPVETSTPSARSAVADDVLWPANALANQP